MTIIRWFLSKAVREAVAMRRHVWKLLQHQRDILKPEEIQAVEGAMGELQGALNGGVPKPVLKTHIMRLEAAANENLKPYPFAAWRENVEVLLVALAVAMGIRTFFLQPFKIPTGSMQPTLFGVTSENLRGRTGVVIPKGWDRVRDWFAGASYVRLTADKDGQLTRIDPPLKLLIFNIKQTIWFAGKAHTFWFPPDYGAMRLQDRIDAKEGDLFRAGEEIINVRVSSGDHLFVDRITYNFRSPNRGEIVVFETKGIYKLPQDQFYIKRLVGLGGESIQIGNDRHVVINHTNRLDAATPHFEFVYGFDPQVTPRDSRFSGHVNQTVSESFGFRYSLAPLFQDGSSVFDVPARHLLVFGDNTMNSKDSRDWGAFADKNVIGRSCFVYWPLSKRFGWDSLFH